MKKKNIKHSENYHEKVRHSREKETPREKTESRVRRGMRN